MSSIEFNNRSVKMFIKNKLITTITFLSIFLLINGCSIKHDYAWQPYLITPERISPEASFIEGQEIRIIKGKSNNSKIFLGSVGPHEYYGSEQSLTDGIVDQLSREMRKKGLAIKSTGEKSLEITVNRSEFERGMWKIASTIEYTVKFGNGKAKSYTTRNSSPMTVDQTYNGAVALAVIEIINDPEVLNYIKL